MMQNTKQNKFSQTEHAVNYLFGPKNWNQAQTNNTGDKNFVVFSPADASNHDLAGFGQTVDKENV